jgi:hypothetical protein
LEFAESIKKNQKNQTVMSVTFKNLKKRIVSETAIQQQSRLFEKLLNKPFWIWDKQQHKQEDIRTDGDCCFNHIIGLPTKEGMEKAMFDYEKILYDSILVNDISNYSFKHKHLWVKKATGLGISEFMLRFMAWLCLKDNSLSGSLCCWTKKS